MCSESIDTTSDSGLKKKNKLGYHRQSVACSHCRRRKIRCLPSDFVDGKCENCTRTGKVCHFLKVSEDNVPWPPKRSKGGRAQSFSEQELMRSADYGLPHPIHWQSSESSSFGPSSYTSPSHTEAWPSPGETIRHTHSQPIESTPHWPPGLTQPDYHGHELYQESRRPPLQHRATEPIRSAWHHHRHDEPAYIGDRIAMQPQHVTSYSSTTHFPGSLDALHSSPWPIYGVNSYPASQAKTSERSSSLDGPPQLEDHQGLSPHRTINTPWPRPNQYPHDNTHNPQVPLYSQPSVHYDTRQPYESSWTVP